MNSLSKERKREITHRANNLIDPENIKTNEDTKKALWRLFPKTHEKKQLLQDV